MNSQQISTYKDPKSLEKGQSQLFSTIRRNLNSLKQKQTPIRKNALAELHRIITQQSLSSALFDEIGQMCLKDILKCFSDHSEACRETSVQIIIQLLSRINNLKSFLPYIFSILIDRTNCHDLEGIQNLPQKMRPAPGQKPKVLLKLIENCEQIRLLYCALVRKIIGLLQHENDEIRKYLDDLVHIIRALIMDPAPEVQKKSCETLQLLCKLYKDLLLHYTEIMGRAVLLPLVSKKSRIRISGLHCLTSILWCGLYKYNAFIFQNLIGFRDPNSVPIKDFYQPSHNINYLATFITDPNAKVRQQFMQQLYVWICRLDDKYDHHGKLVPYLLSGLFDTSDHVRQIALRTIQEIGKQIQTEREKDFRENKQFAVDAKWTWQGKLIELPLQQPLRSRPSLGSRFFIRGHVRKFWAALYRQIKDINIQNRKRACNLAIYGCIYTQNYLTQYLDNMIPHLLSSILPRQKQDIQCCQKIEKMFHYIGRYCEQSSYLHIMQSSIEGKMIQNEQFIKASFKGLAKLVEGNLEAVPQGVGLCHKRKDLIELLDMVEKSRAVEEIYLFNASEVGNFVSAIINGLKTKATSKDNAQILLEAGHMISLLKLWCSSYYQLYYSNCSKLTVQSPTPPTTIQQKVFYAFNTLTNLLNLLPTETQLQVLQQYMGQVYQNPPTLMDTDWKVIVVILNYFMRNFQSVNMKVIDGQTEEGLVGLCLDVMGESLAFNRSVQMLNFTAKFVFQMLEQAKVQNTHEKIRHEHEKIEEITDKSNQKLHQLNFKPLASIIQRCLYNLTKFQPQRKLPIYQQPVTHSQPIDPDQLAINQQTFIILYKNISKAFQSFYQRKQRLTNNLLGQILELFIKNSACNGRIKNNNDITYEGIKTLWVCFERESINEEFVKKINKREGTEEGKKEKARQLVMPMVIDYLVEKIQTFSEPQHELIMMLFSTLSRILECFPNFTSAIQPLPLIYPQYNELFNKLIKYAIDEKNIELKQKLLEFLGRAAKKMKPWFELELKMAEESEKFIRAEFIKKILSSIYKY